MKRTRGHPSQGGCLGRPNFPWTILHQPDPLLQKCRIDPRCWMWIPQKEAGCRWPIPYRQAGMQACRQAGRQTHRELKGFLGKRQLQYVQPAGSASCTSRGRDETQPARRSCAQTVLGGAARPHWLAPSHPSALPPPRLSRRSSFFGRNQHQPQRPAEEPRRARVTDLAKPRGRGRTILALRRQVYRLDRLVLRCCSRR